MAVIRETLTLEDKLTNVMTQCIQVAQRMAGAMDDIRFSTMNVETATASAAVEIQNLSARMSQTTTRGNSLFTTVRNLAGAFLGMQSVQWLVGTSDQLTQINARLKMMTGSAEAAAEANEQIYQAAMRSRGAYADMANFVSQLGVTAGNAFDDVGELIAFAEQIQKQMEISGASGASAQAALVQLTQGLASGTLRGEELNSVLEQTPMIAKTIADYMGVTTGEMRELASEGALTADVVKNAILGAAEETNAAFEQMPMTWSQVWAQMQNMAIKALEPVLQAVSWAANNMDTLTPIILGVAAALGVYAAAMAISTAATWLGVAANREFIAQLMKNPFLWIAVAIGFMVYAIYEGIQAVGGLEAAWLIAKDSILTAWDDLQYGAQSFATGVANWMSQMAIHGINAVNALVNGAIDGLNWLIEHANDIVGTSFGTIDHVTIGASRKLSLYAEISDRNANLYALRDQFNAAQRAREAEIRAKQAAIAQSAAPQNPVGYTPYNEIAGSLGDISGSVKSIEKSVSMSEEDIKSLVDAAERRYVANVNLTSQTPVIHITGANTGNTAADRQAIADAVQYVLMEQLASGGVRATSRP